MLGTPEKYGATTVFSDGKCAEIISNPAIWEVSFDIFWLRRYSILVVAGLDHVGYDNGDVKIFDLPGALVAGPSGRPPSESRPPRPSGSVAEADQYLEMGHQRSQWSLPPAVCWELSGDIWCHMDPLYI